MRDEFLQAVDDEQRRHVYVKSGDVHPSMYESFDEKEVKSIGAKTGLGVPFIEGLRICRDLVGEGLRRSIDKLIRNLRPPTKRVNWGNCVAGYNLESCGEDDEYVVLRCSGGNHMMFLAKKTHKHEASNGGFAKDNTVAEIMGENKYDR